MRQSAGKTKAATRRRNPKKTTGHLVDNRWLRGRAGRNARGEEEEEAAGGTPGAVGTRYEYLSPPPRSISFMRRSRSAWSVAFVRYESTCVCLRLSKNRLSHRPMRRPAARNIRPGDSWMAASA